MNNDRYLITGCNDRELRVWEITFLDNKNIEFTTAIGTLDIDEEDEKSVDTDIVRYYILYILYIFIWYYTYFVLYW